MLSIELVEEKFKEAYKTKKKLLQGIISFSLMKEPERIVSLSAQLRPGVDYKLEAGYFVKPSEVYYRHVLSCDVKTTRTMKELNDHVSSFYEAQQFLTKELDFKGEYSIEEGTPELRTPLTLLKDVSELNTIIEEYEEDVKSFKR
ncbi:MAG: hypothetical protein Q7K43_01300 [Candidatus Woesearchaeota archaeon]|nr:hypothetical protein [Candidatus Woesearchaeota archaeon]